MKKLNLLKPDKRVGYLDNGKGEEITYLNVSGKITHAELEEDVNNGAIQFKELLEFSKKKPSQFVVINCNNEEEGLIAASYLFPIYNKLAGITEEDYEGDYNDDISDSINIEFEDFADEDPLGLRDNDWEDESTWEENPWKVPVVTASQMINQGIGDFDAFGMGGNSYGRLINPKRKLPYWCYTRKENLCVIFDSEWVGFGFGNESRLLNCLKRYANNRHVFIIVASTKNIRDCFDNGFSENVRNQFSEIILEYSAGSFSISSDKESRNKYYETIFENWIDSYNYRLCSKFPVKKIVKKILDMRGNDKSALIEKIIKYVIKDDDEPKTLKEKDFEILDQFMSLGLDMSKKEHSSLKKFQNELVGMEAVKDQINGIVEVMRYNKRRKDFGLDTSYYHNVHMLLGAPGTAKTTVAEMLGSIMAEENLLPNDRFISINGAELKGMYVGHSAPKVAALFEEYDIIFIDEAYSISAGTDGDNDSFSQEAIAQLVVELERHGMDKLVIFAGYGGVNVSEKDNKMKKFLESNPGIRSRINSTIYFETYTAEQMLEIFKLRAKLSQFRISNKCDSLIKEFFEQRRACDDFGNGREARSLLENSMVEAAKRLANIDSSKLTTKMMKEITAEDIKNAIDKMKLGFLMQTGKRTQLGLI